MNTRFEKAKENWKLWYDKHSDFIPQEECKGKALWKKLIECELDSNYFNKAKNRLDNFIKKT